MANKIKKLRHRMAKKVKLSDGQGAAKKKAHHTRQSGRHKRSFRDMRGG